MRSQNNILTAILLAMVLFSFSLVSNAQTSIFKSPSTGYKTSGVKVGGHHLAWGPVQTNPSGFTDCLGIAEITLQGFQNFRRSRSEVTGLYGMNYASITCINNTAYVMVVGSEKNKTAEIRNVLMDRFKNSNLALPIASQSHAENYLYFSVTPTKVSRAENCISIAQSAIRAVFPNFRRLSNGADASNDELSAGIACQQNGARMSAIVIVGGGNNQNVLALRDRLVKKMATTVLFDEGTELNPVDN